MYDLNVLMKGTELQIQDRSARLQPVAWMAARPACSAQRGRSLRELWGAATAMPVATKTEMRVGICIPNVVRIRKGRGKRLVNRKTSNDCGLRQPERSVWKCVGAEPDLWRKAQVNYIC